MELISTVTLSNGTTGSINFTGIPQGYTDLLIVGSARTTNTPGYAEYLYATLNGSTSGIYNRKSLYGGTGVSSQSGGNETAMRVIDGLPSGSYSTGSFGNFSMYIPDYAGSRNKRISFDVVIASSNTNGRSTISANNWLSTAAITSVNVYTASTFASGTSMSLYGIKKGSGGANVA